MYIDNIISIVRAWLIFWKKRTWTRYNKEEVVKIANFTLLSNVSSDSHKLFMMRTSQVEMDEEELGEDL